MKKKVFAVLTLAFLLAFSIAPAAWAATVASGECGAQGNNVTWVLDDTGTLTISGTGAMKDYEYENYAPWYDSSDKILTIIVKGGITVIGDEAFWNCESATSITLPNTLTHIGKEAFGRCISLQTLTIPDTVTFIGEGAFYKCFFKDLYLGDGLVDGSNIQFFDCAADNLYIGKNLSNLASPLVIQGTSIGAFYVSEENENFCVKDGVLYNKDLTKLICYPRIDSSDIAPYIVPGTVMAIEDFAFDAGKNLIFSGNAPLLGENGPFQFYLSNNCTITYPADNATWTEDVKAAFENGTNVTWVAKDDEPSVNIPVTGITLDKTEISMLKGGKLAIEYTVNPSNATNKGLKWSVDNPDVVWLDSTVGVIEALKPGTATITFEAVDGSGVKAECKVVVTDSAVPGWEIYNITFDTDGGTLVGASDTVQVTKGQAYKMPTANKSGYTLKHWAIGSKESQIQAKANDVYTFTKDTTVYAIWDKNQSSGGGSHGGGSHGGGSRPSGTTTTKPGSTEKPGDTNKPGTSAGNTGNNAVTAANINNKFADVQNNVWYSEAIAYVYNKGMMNGTDAGRFEPDATTTRAMLVTMLHRLENEPKAGAVNFSDVASGQWFSEAIAWAAANGVVNGYENGDAQLVPNGARGTFGPNDSITREQLAAVLYRLAQLKGYDVSVKGSLSGFSDAANVSGWAREAMQWAVGAGIINGDNGALKPAGNATRAEVAMMLMRYVENVK